MDSVDVLRKEIAELQEQIRHRQEAINALLTGRAKLGHPTHRYFNYRPLDAAREILIAKGTAMTRSALEEEMVAGGILIGKKRGKANIRISLDLNIQLGNLLEKDGMISLAPETEKAPSGSDEGAAGRK